MKKTKVSSFLRKELITTEFFNSETNYGGVIVTLNGKRLGTIVGLSIPDSNDIAGNIDFDNKVTDWICDTQI